MTCRLLSKKVLEFNVPLPILRPGAPSGSREQWKAAGERTFNGKEVYISALKTYAKMAVAEQGWEMNRTDTLYVVAVLNICPIKYLCNRKDKETGVKVKRSVTDMNLVRSKKLAMRKPDIDIYTRLLFKALKGIVFENPNQVVAMTVMRRYNNRDGLDLLVGAATDWKELIHDLRNA